MFQLLTKQELIKLESKQSDSEIESIGPKLQLQPKIVS